jgi:hypothetical protein
MARKTNAPRPGSGRAAMAASAARFHRQIGQDAAQLAQRRPAAWRVYATWHEQHPKPGLLTESECADSICAYVEEQASTVPGSEDSGEGR